MDDTFITIEAFNFDVEDGHLYEGDRNEDLDLYWVPSCGDLNDFLITACENHLEDQTAMVIVASRDYVTFDDDGEVEDYGGCSWPETFVWHNHSLLTEEEYLDNK
jgi:hypothetical protein